MEKKTITTPSGISVVLKAWITGKEAMQIDAPFTNLKMTLDTTGVGKGEVNAGEAAQLSQKTAIETVNSVAEYLAEA